MDIIAGYKGIMELDLTGVRQELKKELAWLSFNCL